jgi:hypothetical protein
MSTALPFELFTYVVKIKIVHAAWLRDDTWPPGGVAPEPDDEAPDSDEMILDNKPPPKFSEPYPSLSAPLTECSSSVTTPRLTSTATTQS